MGFLDSMDIANSALQKCGAPQILSPTEDSKVNTEASFSYDKLRRVELRRNTWRFATRKVCLRAVDTNTMLVQPTLYNAATTYQPGAIVADANNQWWLSMTEENLNNAPGGNNEVWEAYFGPKTIEPWDTTGGTTYWTGELVYMSTASPGGYVIYQSLVNANSDVPNTTTPWSALVQYNGDAVVSYLGQQWNSLLELNLNVTPATGPLNWASGTTYSTAQTVTGSDHLIYSSVGNGNIGHDPTTDGGVHWTNTNVANGWILAPIQIASSINWRVILATMTNLSFSYPLGSGPSSQSETRNVFRLPAGYLKVAPQDPKAGSSNFLGAPSGIMYEDWLFSGDYIVSRDTGPIIFRFIADMTTVSQFDDMFCEGLACRIAIGICPSVTQSTEKVKEIEAEYKVFMGEARTVNAIEIGPVEPPEDDFITCRI